MDYNSFDRSIPKVGFDEVLGVVREVSAQWLIKDSGLGFFGGGFLWLSVVGDGSQRAQTVLAVTLVSGTCVSSHLIPCYLPQCFSLAVFVFFPASLVLF